MSILQLENKQSTNIFEYFHRKTHFITIIKNSLQNCHQKLIFVIHFSIHKSTKDKMHSARAAFGSEIRDDISIPNISYKATPPRTVILNIIYAPSRTKRERPVDSPGIWVLVRACVHKERTSDTHNRAAQSVSSDRESSNRKTISIHCSGQPINIINISRLNYRVDLARWNNSTRRFT